MNVDFPIEIIRTERKKSASIVIEDDLVKVVVPKTLSDQRIEGLVNKRTAWIKKRLKIHAEAIRSKPKEYVNGEIFPYLGCRYRLKCLKGTTGKVKLKNGYLNVPVAEHVCENEFEQSVRQSLHQWYQSKAREKLTEKTKRYAAILGVHPRSVAVKEYRARWGSCSSGGDITYNWRIIIAAHRIVDYIVIHELCHLLEHNHGPKYWKHVQGVVPNYRDHREWLKIHGEGLLKV